MQKTKTELLKELKELPYWVNWTKIDTGAEKPDKKPYNPNIEKWPNGEFRCNLAKSNDSTTFGTYEKVIENMNINFKLPYSIINNEYKNNIRKFDGYGFMFSMDNLYIGIDIDNCVINGLVNDDILDINEHKLNKSYMELSQSKKGIHIIVKLKTLEEKQKLQEFCGTKTGLNQNFELYYSNRYFALTESIVYEYDEINIITYEEIISFIEKYFKLEKKENIHTSSSSFSPLMSDNEVIEKCMNSKKINKDDEFNIMFNNSGLIETDESREDGKFISCLVYFTQDIEQIIRICQNSPRSREKYNRIDYMTNTITKIINSKSKFYQQTKIELTKNQKITLKKIKKVYKIFIDKLESEIKMIQKKGEKNLSKEEIKFIEQKSKYIESLNNSTESGKIAIEAYSIFEDNNLASKITKFKELFLVKYKIYYIGNQINPYYLSQLISLYFPMIYWAGKLLMYHEGVYKSIEPEYLKKIFFYILEKRDTRNLKGELLDQIYSINHVPIENFHNIIESKNNVINFKNGFLTFDENFLLTGNIAYKLESHTPEYKSVYQLAYDFNDKLTIEEILKNTPKFTKFLNTSLNDEKEKRLALEKLAYTFFNRRVCQEITYICGEGGNGKGTYQRILQELHKCVIKNPDISELTDPEKRNNFFTGKLLLTPAIFSSEAKKTIKDTSLLKKNSGNDSLSFELKHKNGDFNMPLYEKIFISTNHTVKFLNWEKADERRAHFLEMNNKIKIDNELEQIILNKEMDYVLMYVIHKGLFPLITRKFKTFTLPDSHYRLFKHYQEYNNNILCFINKHIEVDPNGTLLKANIKPLFNNEFSGVYKNTSNLIEKFETELKNQNIEFLSGKVRGKDINGCERAGYVGYKGIKYVEFKEDENIDANEDI